MGTKQLMECPEKEVAQSQCPKREQMAILSSRGVVDPSLSCLKREAGDPAEEAHRRGIGVTTRRESAEKNKC